MHVQKFNVFDFFLWNLDIDMVSWDNYPRMVSYDPILHYTI